MLSRLCLFKINKKFHATDLPSFKRTALDRSLCFRSFLFCHKKLYVARFQLVTLKSFSFAICPHIHVYFARTSAYADDSLPFARLKPRFTLCLSHDCLWPPYPRMSPQCDVARTAVNWAPVYDPQVRASDLNEMVLKKIAVILCVATLVVIKKLVAWNRERTTCHVCVAPVSLCLNLLTT